MKDDILQRLLQLIPDGINLDLPPKVFIDMEGEFIEFVENHKLVARFPNKERYMNPFGSMQGGIIVAAMDNTIAPLSFVSGPPSVTKEIDTHFKRSIKPSDHFVEVVATVVEKTTSYIMVQGRMLNEKGKIAAECSAKCVYIKVNRNK